MSWALPQPDYALGIGSEKLITSRPPKSVRAWRTDPPHQPDLMVVVGDVNSTMAAALVAAKERYPLPCGSRPAQFRPHHPE